MCPRGRRLLQGDGGLLEPARIVCHVLLVEASDGLVLIDTGFGREDVLGPRRLPRAFAVPLAARPRLEETAYEQVRSLGFAPEDVRHIVLTHLDVDHAGGLPDFPAAEVHLSAAEHEARLAPPLGERPRYALGAAHWSHGPRWVAHGYGGDSWFGFESVRVVPGAEPEVVLIPLPGHTLGHAGIAVRTGERWLLHCGDAYFDRRQVEPGGGDCTPLLGFYQRLVAADEAVRRANQERLRELARASGDQVELICSHDPVLLDAFAARAAA